MGESTHWKNPETPWVPYSTQGWDETPVNCEGVKYPKIFHAICAAQPTSLMCPLKRWLVGEKEIPRILGREEGLSCVWLKIRGRAFGRLERVGRWRKCVLKALFIINIHCLHQSTAGQNVRCRIIIIITVVFNIIIIIIIIIATSTKEVMWFFWIKCISFLFFLFSQLSLCLSVCLSAWTRQRSVWIFMNSLPYRWASWMAKSDEIMKGIRVWLWIKDFTFYNLFYTVLRIWLI